MCIPESMIELISISITAIATLCAAFAAWMSYQVSKNTLEFQKKYSKNQQLIGRLNIDISKLHTLKYLISNPLSIADEKFESIEPLLIELKAELQSLEEIGVFDYATSKISKVSSLSEMVDHMAKENNYITEVIKVLEKRVDDVFK